jgi:hypothetical protein
VFFNRELVTDFRFRYKRGGHLWCKTGLLTQGPGGPTGPLRTPFRTPATLSGLTKTH